jgi:very-short-patch-repair endonuclease
MAEEAQIANARHLRKNLTDAEQKLWRRIRSCQIQGCKFRRQAPIGKYIADFVCLEQKLIIEIDGGQHAVQREYDHNRSEWLKSRGFMVIRFWNNEVLNNMDGVMEVISRMLTPHPDLPPQGGKG